MNLQFHPKNKKSYDVNKKSSDKITFNIDDPSCAIKFMDHVDALAGHLGLSLKKEGPAMAMAMHNGKKPVFTYPTTPAANEQQDQSKMFVYERDYTRVDDEKRECTENNNRA